MENYDRDYWNCSPAPSHGKFTVHAATFRAAGTLKIVIGKTFRSFYLFLIFNRSFFFFFFYDRATTTPRRDPVAHALDGEFRISAYGTTPGGRIWPPFSIRVVSRLLRLTRIRFFFESRIIVIDLWVDSESPKRFSIIKTRWYNYWTTNAAAALNVQIPNDYPVWYRIG